MKTLAFLILLFFPIASFAGSSRILPVAYTEYSYGGASRDYTSLATWDSDTDNDLVTATSGVVLTCYADEGPYDDNVTLEGATTSSSYFRVIRAAPGHRGTPIDGVRFRKSGAISLSMVGLAENYAQAHDIAASCATTSTAVYCYAICFYNFSVGNKFIGCTAYDTDALSKTTAQGGGFWLSYYPAVVANCYAYDVQGSFTSSGGFSCLTMASGDDDLVQYLYNCTAIGCSKGIVLYNQISSNTLTVYAKNCIAQDNTNNTSLVGSYTKTLTEDPSIVTSGVTFKADGYHLDSTDTGAIGDGVDLSADGTFAFSDDIDGETRSDWDIGADEYLPASAWSPMILMQ